MVAAAVTLVVAGCSNPHGEPSDPSTSTTATTTAVAEEALAASGFVEVVERVGPSVVTVLTDGGQGSARPLVNRPLPCSRTAAAHHTHRLLTGIPDVTTSMPGQPRERSCIGDRQVTVRSVRAFCGQDGGRTSDSNRRE